MKTTNNYEAPVAEKIEMYTPVVLVVSVTDPDPGSGFEPGP